MLIQTFTAKAKQNNKHKEEQITDEYIVKYFYSSGKKRLNKSKLVNIPDNILTYLNKRYNDSYSIEETIQRIHLNTDKHPICPNCGKHCKYVGGTRFFLQTCGDTNCSKKINKEHGTQTCLEKYGVDNVAKAEQFKVKKEIQDKEIPSQVKEKTNIYKCVNEYKSGDDIEQQLKDYFDTNNINYIYQYKSELYPFACDFYFPDKDLYVEIQGSWTHGGHPYTNTQEDILIVNKWTDKNTKYYNNAIHTWTVSDVNKRETAKNNKLNYLEIFSIDFNECINIIVNKRNEL